MIVKVQRSQFSSDGLKKILVYDESRKYMHETEDPETVEEIEAMMKGKQKAFFHAEIVDTEFHISHPAEWQDW